jgi:hypothetical protein
LCLIASVQIADAYTFTPAPAANIDLSQLGRVGLAGNFDGISLYEYEGQGESSGNNNGSQSILARYPNGAFATLATMDGDIKAMCPFVMNGAMAGIVVAGNFTSTDGSETQGVALFHPDTGKITPLTGLSGQVSTLYCEPSTNTVYVGGSFKGANSTNAIAWVGTAGWTNLPFNGFNGPVSAITKAANGHIIFGGTFTSLGNSSAPNDPDGQVINLSGGLISSGSSATTAGFDDPKNIICKTNGTDGAGNTWLLADNTPGYWRADFRFGFRPTKIRLWNTHLDGRGTKTWRFTALPINGIMNMTYTDPSTGSTASCTNQCPLSNNASVPYQDFHFVNLIGMDAFRIDISEWYGSGAGFTGIELFEDDIFVYAVEDFNEPTCNSIQTASKTTSTGPWVVTPRRNEQSDYLTASLTGSTIDPSAASIVLYPDIKQSGNYSVNMYTPGCLQDNTCGSRGIVNLTISTSAAQAPIQTQIFQTNDYDKFDQIYFGYVDAASGSFRPSVTMSPSSGQINNLTMVAHRVEFVLTSHSGGLNSIFEYDPTQAVVNMKDSANSTYDQAGLSLNTRSWVSALATANSTTYVGGNFSTSKYSNVFAVTASGATPVAGGGLNGHVLNMFLNGTLLYVAGNFSDTSNPSMAGLNNVALYDTSKDSWQALGAGVNGEACNIVPVALDISGSTPETVIAFTGYFDQILAFGNNPAVSVPGLAIWVPSRNNWLPNLKASTILLEGRLSAFSQTPAGETFYAGSITSEQVSANGIASLGSTLGTFPLSIQPSQQSESTRKRRRASNGQSINGVVTGAFYNQNGRNLTILGGHFNATATNGSAVHNLVFINGSNSNAVTGLGPDVPSDSTFLALAVQNDTLYAGGAVTGTTGGNQFNGIISYDFRTAALSTPPLALVGDNVVVNAIVPRPSSNDIFVAGTFSRAGSLDCPGVCIFTASTGQWTRPGTNLTGTASGLLWSSSSTLVAAGSLTIGGSNASVASYDTSAQAWKTFAGANSIPGPATALTAGSSDGSQLWLAGTATNGSAFLMKYDGTNWNPAGYTLGSGSTIQGLQVLAISQNHDSTPLLDANQVLLLTGSLNLPGFGNASAALFNGSSFQPFALTSSTGSGPGSLSQIFFENQQNVFSSSGKRY